MKKIIVLLGLCMMMGNAAAGDQRHALNDSRQVKKEVSSGTLNPYLPNVSCNYSAQKIWFNGTTKKWECVNDRTKTNTQ